MYKRQGLHIVKEYVSLHGGEIKVEDNHPQGTIFTVILPITKTLKLNCTEDTSCLLYTSINLRVISAVFGECQQVIGNHVEPYAIYELKWFSNCISYG